MPTVKNEPKISVSHSLFDQLQSAVNEQGQVVIHGFITAEEESVFIRIWPTTFLFDLHSTHKSHLVYFEKISAFPAWTEVKARSSLTFTLVFTGLPKTCRVFDLIEIIPQFNGFQVSGIRRNAEDVYFLDFDQ